MDNELRKKRVLEGIAMLGKGVNPINYIHDTLICGVKEYLGITWDGFYILNGEIAKNGFYKHNGCDQVTMLHNWKRFYELIKDLK